MILVEGILLRPCPNVYQSSRDSRTFSVNPTSLTVSSVFFAHYCVHSEERAPMHLEAAFNLPPIQCSPPKG